MSQENEIEAKNLSQTTDFLPSDGASCCASLSARQIDILDHTVTRAAGGRYCGGGEDMDSLVEIGLMKYIGTPAWCPDKFYAITEMGRAVLIRHNAKLSHEEGGKEQL